MRIEVTAEDIKNGKMREPHACPIALALRRHTGTDYGVGLNTITGPWDSYIMMPLLAKAFVRAYDSAYSRFLARPFSFDIDLPAPTVVEEAPKVEEEELVCV